MGLENLQLSFYPSGIEDPNKMSAASDWVAPSLTVGPSTSPTTCSSSAATSPCTWMSVFLRGPPGVLVDFSIGVDGEWKHLGCARGISSARGWAKFLPVSDGKGIGRDGTGKRAVKIELQVHGWQHGFEWQVMDAECLSRLMSMQRQEHVIGSDSKCVHSVR